MSLDWGSVPDWFAGIGSVAALIFAGGAARAAIRTNRNQAVQVARMELAEQKRDEEWRREQANQIVAWVALDSNAQPSVLCVNGSGRPVYNLTLSCRVGMVVISCSYAVKGPDLGPKQLNVATQKVRGYAGDQSSEVVIDWGALYRGGDLRVSMRFLDVAGRWWNRDEAGKLEEVAAPD